MDYPAALQEIIDFFAHLSADEKRDNLIAYAEGAKSQEPHAGEHFDLEDTRQDAECTDTVGIFLKVCSDDSVLFRVTLGPHVQTLTRAMTTILCKGLNGSPLHAVLDLSHDFVPTIVGQELVRVRSHTIYYVLGRMKTACQSYLRHRRDNLSRD